MSVLTDSPEAVYKAKIALVMQMSRILSEPIELPDLLQTALDQLIHEVETLDFGMVGLQDAGSETIRLVCISGSYFAARAKINASMTGSVFRRIYNDGLPRLLVKQKEIASVWEEMLRAGLSPGTGQQGIETGSALPSEIAILRLHINHKRLGLMLLGSFTHMPEFLIEDFQLLQSIADLVALAVHRMDVETGRLALQYDEQRGRLRSEVMATLSHELRTPLATIKGYTTALMLDEIQWTEAKRRDFLQLIDQECDNMQTMIGDLMDSALIDVGQLVIDPEPVHVCHLVSDIVKEMKSRTTLHQFMVDFPPGFPFLLADPRWIRQVLRNILDNAVKYSPDGGMVVIRGEIRSNDIVISIADEGVGISPENLIPLFEKYFRVKSPTGYHVPGTGLGLPVARAIVEAHDGHIWAESKVGHGTTISFSLPVHDLDSGAEPL